MKKPPIRAKIDGSFVEPLSEWTVATVRTAISQHERGIFRSSARLADAMGREARIAKALRKRATALSSRSALPFSVTPSVEGDGRKRSAAAKRQEELWWDVCPESVVEALHRDTITMGMALGYIEWRTERNEWIPRLNWLPLHGLTWERASLDGERGESWIYTSADGTRHQVSPGDGRWFLHMPSGPRSWLQGAVRFLGLPWFLSVCIERDWARYDEKHGLPILSIDEPYWAWDDTEGEDGADSSVASAYFEQFKNLAAESVLRNPQGATKEQGGWSAQWLEPKSDSSGSFKAHLEHLGDLFEQGISGKDESGAKGGDGELPGERTKSEFLGADAEGFASSFRVQVWKPFSEYNYGDRDVAGWGRWDTRPPADLSARATTLKTMAEAVQILAPMNVDCAPVLEEFGLKATGKIEAPEPAPAPAPDPAPAPQEQAA